MTSKLKILLPVGLIIILIAILSISKWSSKKNMTGTNQTTTGTTQTAPLPAPTGDVKDLLNAVDQSTAVEGTSATSDTVSSPQNGTAGFDQSLNNNGI